MARLKIQSGSEGRFWGALWTPGAASGLMGVQETSCAAGMHHSSMGLVENCQHAQPDRAKESTCTTGCPHLRLLQVWQLQRHKTSPTLQRICINVDSAKYAKSSQIRMATWYLPEYDVICLHECCQMNTKQHNASKGLLLHEQHSLEQLGMKRRVRQCTQGAQAVGHSATHAAPAGTSPAGRATQLPGWLSSTPG